MSNTITSPKPFCFVLMPFSDEFDDVYQFGIKEVCESAGAYCERVDEQIFHESILDRLYNQIAKADFIIADMTGRNANVFYEVGYAHALGKRTILLTQNADDIPFDLKHYPHIIYDKKISLLREELERRVAWCIQNPESKGRTDKIEVEIFHESRNLSAERLVFRAGDNGLFDCRLTIQNAGTQILESANFRIGLVVSDWWSIAIPGQSTMTELPDGRFLHMFPSFDAIFPSGFTSISFDMRVNCLFSSSQEDTDDVQEDTDDVIVRVFTSAGSRDYPFSIQFVKTQPSSFDLEVKRLFSSIQ